MEYLQWGAEGGKPRSCCGQCGPSQGVPALAGLLGSARHSQGAVWWQGDLCQARGVCERSWEALSCQPLLPVPQLLRGSCRKGPYGTRKTIQLCLCVQASLLLHHLSDWKKVDFTSPWQFKERLPKQTYSRAWMGVPQVVPDALPFHQGGKFCLPSLVGPTNFTLKSFQTLEYWNVAQMWLNPEEKGR